MYLIFIFQFRFNCCAFLYLYIIFTTSNIKCIFPQPRLGPKPFTPPKLENESFQKVFSVPTAPTSDTNGTHEPLTPVSEPPKFIESTPTDDPQKSPTSDIEATPIKDEDKNGKYDSSSLEEEANSSDSGYKPKTPSTAERRKLFEGRSNSKENEPEDQFDSEDKLDNFERSSVQRNSIAERRKMYENRSQSVQESTTEKTENKSPVMRRKDSLKTRKSSDDILKEERESRPIPRQQSLDPQAGRKAEPVAPTPKRTSTVFGM